MPELTNTVLRKVFEPLSELFFPPACLRCDTIIEMPTPLHKLCGECFGDMQLLNSPAIAESCLKELSPVFLDGLWVAYPFDESVQALIHAFKYRQMPGLARHIGEFLRRSAVMPAVMAESEWAIPVPLHRRREHRRGYNQSAFLAEGLFGNARLSSKILIRKLHTTSQASLSRAQRQRNVRDAFSVRLPSAVAGRKVTLVDDVFTTGATLNECARVLKSCGAQAVFAVTLATPVSTPDGEKATTLQES